MQRELVSWAVALIDGRIDAAGFEAVLRQLLAKARRGLNVNLVLQAG
jgi:hypothetical protein